MLGTFSFIASNKNQLKHSKIFSDQILQNLKDLKFRNFFAMKVSLTPLHVFLNLNCELHTLSPAQYINSNENAPQKLFCEQCFKSTNQDTNFVKLKDIKDKNLISNLSKASAEEGLDGPEEIIQRISQQFDQLKTSMNEIIESSKKQAIANYQKAIPRKKSWNTMVLELNKKYEELFSQENIDPKSLDFENFVRAYSNAQQLLNAREKEPKVFVNIFGNEFAKLQRGLEEKFNTHKEKLLKIEQIAKKGQTAVAPLTMKNLGKERILKVDYTKGFKPTAITYIPGYNWLVLSGDKDLSLWSMRNFEKFQQIQNISSISISNMIYTPERNALIVSTFGREVKIFGINKTGIQKVVKTIKLGFDSSVYAICINPERTLFLGCGAGRGIKIWSLRDFTLRGMINTGLHADFGPHMAYCKKERLVACFMHKTGNIGIFCMKKRGVFAIIQTDMKANDVFSLDLAWVEKKSLLVTTREHGKLMIYSFKDRKMQTWTDIPFGGYSMGIVPFEEEEYVLIANYMKDLQVLNIGSKKIFHNVVIGLKNGFNLIHMKDLRKFAIPDCTDKICIVSY